MKKLVTSILTIALVLTHIFPAFAIERRTYQKVISEDLYIVYTLEEISTSKATYQKVGRKSANVMNGSTLLWTVTVIGTFTYDGFHSSCTKAEVSTTCPASAWKIASSSATKSGSSATARATGQRYNNGVVVQTLTEAVSLVCGSDGTLY